MTKWQKKLTKAERDHLKWAEVRSLSGAKYFVEFQKVNQFPCWNCVSIAGKLGVDLKLTAFHKRTT